jgi:hypothetical protein
MQKALSIGLISIDHIFLRILDQSLDRAFRTFNRSNAHFAYDPDVLSFWQCVKFYHGESAVLLLQGPGLHSKFTPGKSAKGENRTDFKFSDYTIPGPSLTTIRKKSPAAQKLPGLSRDLVVSALQILFDPLRKEVTLVCNTTVSVIPVALSSDGFAIKPGLQVDQSSRTVVGMSSGPVNTKTIRDHPVINPSDLKRDIVTDVVEVGLTAITANVFLPIGVLFKPKSKTGSEWLTDFTCLAEQVATCLDCARDSASVRDQVLVGGKCVTTACKTCEGKITVCGDCFEAGHRFVDVCFRACDSCIRDRKHCKRFTSLMLPADCEQYQNTGMKLWNKRHDDNRNNTLTALSVAIPEFIHVDKRVRAAVKNYYMSLDGQRINLKLIKTLKNQGSAETQKLLRNLPASAVTFKDNMDVDSMLHISSSEVRKMLAQQMALVVERVPERDAFWTNNRPGVIKSPRSICSAGFGHVAFTDSDTGKLLTVDNHQPGNVSVLVKGLDHPDCITHARGLIVFAETGKKHVLKYVDLRGNLVLVPAAMRVAQLKSALRDRSLATSGNKEDLGKRLQAELDKVKASAEGDQKVVASDQSDDKTSLSHTLSDSKNTDTHDEQKKKRGQKTRPEQLARDVIVSGIPDNTIIQALLLSPDSERLIVSGNIESNTAPAIWVLKLVLDGLSVKADVTKTILLNQGMHID